MTTRWTVCLATVVGLVLAGVGPVRAIDPETPSGGWSAYEEDADVAGLVTAIGGRSESRSVGDPTSGHLVNGVPISPHPGFVIRDRRRAWATSLTAAALQRGFDHLLANHPGRKRAMVLDVSLRDGGPIPGHHSHRSGRDVDLTLFRHQCAGACDLRTTPPEELDTARQWALLRHWLKRREIDFAFLDYRLQAELYDQAAADGASAQELRRWFQYPRGETAKAGVIRHASHHQDHLHVRFRCTAASTTCRGARRRSHDRARPTPDDATEQLLYELLESRQL